MKVNPVGKCCSEVDRAYTAGFLDADGAIMATIEKHQEKKFGFRVRVTVKITQKERKGVQWFFQKYRIGYLRKNRRVYEWIVRDQKLAKKLLQILLPYIKVKQIQAQKALKILSMTVVSYNDLLVVAQLADALSQFNVRSKNRRKNYLTMIKEQCSRND